VDRLLRAFVKRCPHVVDIVEIPIYFPIIYFSTFIEMNIYKNSIVHVVQLMKIRKNIASLLKEKALNYFPWGILMKKN
jgi:hypothetical protein